MNTKQLLGLSFLVLLVACRHEVLVPSPVDAVNPLMGTASTFAFSHGNTYPAVAVPWGMNFWSPQTGENGGGWMYTYADSLLRGFRQTHQPSPWINDYGTFSIMPLSGDLKLDDKERGVRFSHAAEQASPHVYRVVFDNGMTTALTATSRGAVMEVTWPENEGQYIVVDAYGHGGTVRVDSINRRVYGVSRYNNGGVPDNFGNYFLVEFDKPLTEAGTDAEGRAYVSFDLQSGEVLTIRAASSFISPEQARLNFDREVKEHTLAEVAESARQAWDGIMNRIRVEGGTEEQRSIFYSCLYRTLLFPRKLTEFGPVNEPKYYSPYDGQVHNGEMYTDNGFWDTFRAVHPLFTLLYPEVSEKVQQSLC